MSGPSNDIDKIVNIRMGFTVNSIKLVLADSGDSIALAKLENSAATIFVYSEEIHTTVVLYSMNLTTIIRVI